MAGFEAISAIGSHRANEKKDIDNNGGMFMASAPVQHPNSLYANTGVHLTDEQRTGSIFA